MENISGFFVMVWHFIPFVVLYLLGILIAFFYRSRLKEAWKFLAAGCSLLLLGTVVGISYSVWMVFFAIPNDYNAESLGIAALAFGSVNVALGVIGFVLVLVAAVVGRDGAAIIETEQ